MHMGQWKYKYDLRDATSVGTQYDQRSLIADHATHVEIYILKKNTSLFLSVCQHSSCIAAHLHGFLKSIVAYEDAVQHDNV